MVMEIDDVLTPAAVVDLERLKRNIGAMAEFAAENGVNLRPHVKTHKCSEIAKLQQDYGCKGITVATLGEASAFVEDGFDDITLAKPFVQGKEKDAIRLADHISLKLLVDHPYTVDILQESFAEENIDVRVLLKVDCGYHRCGVNPKQPSAIRLAQKIDEAPNLDFEGILTHGGHAYGATSSKQIQRIAQQEQKVMIQFAHELENANGNLEPRTVSVGSTPTMTQHKEIEGGITEIRPGNYAFFDYTQAVLGSCHIQDIALSVIATVIGTYEGRVVIDAGATALSKDRGPVHLEPHCGYGKIVHDYKSGTLDDNSVIHSLSQEHGKITIENGSTLQKVEPGTKVRILPNHSCLVANLFGRYHISDNGKIIKTWDIHRERLDDTACRVAYE
ncbi:MAG: alanine racemase [Candidatus Thorarchaeota archaeon]